MAEVGSLQFAGYHGTSIGSAREIEQSGFNGDAGPICFAPLDDLSFAQDHGRRRAEERGDNQYGVVQASFPTRKVEPGLHSNQINIPAADAGRIVVQSVLVFEACLSGLLAPQHIDLSPIE